ncbi:pantoate--beta-alanine ligase [Pseudohongiella sp.]|uniref:pantoate--beta-alanine ligase (AMP-forming) n=1 Tax=marine sediment metagenome TaxID=412755 RepID=A0A0F9VZ54_9ZZZZ|nr:pantoate--beta-alanine ligase [Pseudohongiella sp.]HDZ10481.1 pantoate--beta-alanine ligase [Pseudohongiella sp.]HEA63884.1 pantoate--beta-alanine ligase [Pseudohongiella sp.]
MRIIHHVNELRALLDDIRRAGKRIAVVPTMGNLHRGHIRLVETAVTRADFVVSTIFVNPMQFGRNEDLDTYPRTPDADIEKLTTAGCHCLFAPPVSDIYPNGLDDHTVVSVPAISERHCGASRPGHFDGVATVVSKLFNLVQPDIAIFGLKDYQQFQVIRKMTSDLCFRIDIIGVATERDTGGLALSSRNGYLSDAEKETARQLYQTLTQTAERLTHGAQDFRALEREAQQSFITHGIKPDYFNICQADTLAPANAADQHLVIVTAAFVGATRLIDNIEVTLKK